MSTATQKDTNAQGEKKKYVYKTPHVTLYGKGDSAISFSYLKHERESEFKGHKINVTSTNDLFNTKTAVYIESNELVDFLLVLLGKKGEMSAKRSKQISGTNKSFFAKLNGDKLYVGTDSEGKDKLGFSVPKLEKLVLYKLIMFTLKLELKDQYTTTFSDTEILDTLDLINIVQIQQTNSSQGTHNITDSEDNSEKDNEPEGYGKLVYVNTYNEKDFKNTFLVKNSVVEFVKEKADKIKSMKTEDKKALAKKIKDNVLESDKEKVKFLSEKNIETLQIL